MPWGPKIWKNWNPHKPSEKVFALLKLIFLQILHPQGTLLNSPKPHLLEDFGLFIFNLAPCDWETPYILVFEFIAETIFHPEHKPSWQTGCWLVPADTRRVWLQPHEQPQSGPHPGQVRPLNNKSLKKVSKLFQKSYLRQEKLKTENYDLKNVIGK